MVSDLEAVTDTLVRGFPDRPRAYWTRALETLRTRQRPAGCPRFGFLLEAQGGVVGVLLLIFHRRDGDPETAIRCNTSSLCVDPTYQAYSPLLSSIASRLKHVTYFNISASRHTWPIVEALGYRRYSQGQFVAIPALSRGPPARISPLGDGADHGDLPEYALMRAHVEAGCLALVCERDDGLSPFVFLRRRIRHAPFGVMQLIYCRDTASFVSAAGPLGRFLLGHRILGVICDADGPIAGLAGFYFADKSPRYYKGPLRPNQNDLAFTEMVLFGP
jgi:hypothetical protein